MTPNFPKPGLDNICSWGCNCKAYDLESYTCNFEKDKTRSEYCGIYKALEKNREKSIYYKEWRLRK